MKILNKIIILIMVILIIFTLVNTAQINAFASPSLNNNNKSAINIAVLLYSFDDLYMQQLKQSFENIEKENQNKVKFTFYDGKNNVTVQNETLDSLLKDDIDLFIINLADVRENILEDVISKIKQKGVPVVFTEINPVVASKISKYYDKVAFTSTNSKEIGTLQGKMITNLWNTKKEIMDKDGDNILQYIILEGEANNQTAIERTQNVISTLNNAGIKTKQLTRINANWLKELAKESMEAAFFKYAGNIEAIISNNDAMAIGAIEALQKYGYNKSDKSKYISVFGIDGISEAKDLIDKGFMSGTIAQDPKYLAEGLYKIGINLINNVSPIENTDYKMSDKVITIPMHRKEYINMENTSVFSIS